MKEAMKYADEKKYEEGENQLKMMEAQLKYWSTDKILSGMQRNMEEQRELISLEKCGTDLKILVTSLEKILWAYIEISINCQ